MPLMLRRFMLIVALSLLYFAVGKFGLHFGFIHPLASAFWPPTGLAIAALLVFGKRIWPAIFIGAFLVNATGNISPFVAFVIAIGNTLEGVIAALLINRFAHAAAVFERAADILKFAGIALFSTIISASIGVGALFLGANAVLHELPLIWLTWWLGDATGAIIFTPLLVLWWLDHRWRRNLQQLGEALLVIVSIALT
ncbi:MAG: MASE1 domain-containing protein [Gammaproteobacteria bacterium]|nr:MASE1 domain-containing protein [Gammaproteobacteria bacterium]